MILSYSSKPIIFVAKKLPEKYIVLGNKSSYVYIDLETGEINAFKGILPDLIYILSKKNSLSLKDD